jgi:hypothetical protein
MPRGELPSIESDVRALVSDFAGRLAAMIEADVLQRAQTIVLSALGGHEIGNGRRKNGQLMFVHRSRKKPPVQLCPVPGCKNPAAPVFGMVCKEHKDLPKAKIKKYREARRAKKVKAAA